MKNIGTKKGKIHQYNKENKEKKNQKVGKGEN